MDKAKRVADDLRKCADILNGLADELSPAVQEAPAETEPPAKRKSVPSEAAKPAKEPPVTLEAVRAVAAKIARAGGTEQVKALIEQHGADKLSAVPPAEYAALLKELEGIGDGT